MAYNNYFPQIYQPYPTQPNTPNALNTLNNPMNNVSTQNQIQNGGFIVARSEQEVINYPVALGNCVTFKIEGQPIVMEKSMGFSQLEAPHIEKYRLVKEPIEKTQETVQNDVFDIEGINTSINDIIDRIGVVEREIDVLKNNMTKKTSSSKKKEVNDDDPE